MCVWKIEESNHEGALGQLGPNMGLLEFENGEYERELEEYTEIETNFRDLEEAVKVWSKSRNPGRIQKNDVILSFFIIFRQNLVKKLFK